MNEKTRPLREGREEVAAQLHYLYVAFTPHTRGALHYLLNITSRRTD